MTTRNYNPNSVQVTLDGQVIDPSGYATGEMLQQVAQDMADQLGAPVNVHDADGVAPSVRALPRYGIRPVKGFGHCITRDGDDVAAYDDLDAMADELVALVRDETGPDIIARCNEIHYQLDRADVPHGTLGAPNSLARLAERVDLLINRRNNARLIAKKRAQIIELMSAHLSAEQIRDVMRKVEVG